MTRRALAGVGGGKYAALPDPAAHATAEPPPMSTAVSAPPDRFAVRLAGVGAVVFLANFGLLVLQLVAGRLLSPFIGSSLETWTSVIAAMLSGIALGNFLGGRVAERPPSVGKLALVLLAGVAATLWVAALPMLLTEFGWHARLGLTARIPALAFALCLPVATVLSLLTPLAIRFGVPDVARTGSVAGTVFALSSLGCLLGTYLTGFVLIPEMAVNPIVYAVAGLLAATGLGALALGGGGATADPPKSPPSAARPTGRPALPLAVGFGVVFLCSFAGMCLELAASRIVALQLGVSLFTWTGVIGVMLAGTCLGNWVGGKVADRAHRGGNTDRPLTVLAGCLLLAAVCSVLVLVVLAVASNQPLGSLGLIGSVLALTFALFFLPMTLLGTISPQVIRLCVWDVQSAGQTAGRVYAVSTAGAIAGTFAAGYVLIAALGMKGTVLLVAALPCVAAAALVRVWKHPAMLYAMSVVGGALLGGTVLLFRVREDVVVETNYYTIRVDYDRQWRGLPNPLAAAVGVMPAAERDILGTLCLDKLIHSEVNLNDPTFFKYRHEQVQLEAVYAAAARTPAQRVLVVGGGGYTLPRAVRTLVPTAAVDVVEIDPGVTRVAYQMLGLKKELDIRSFHRDGRQFVAEDAAPNSYDVVSLDAVNDYSVPGHLLTKECNEAVKRTLAADGVYLVTVIDLVKDGKLWKAAFHTLRKSFKHVYFTLPAGDVEASRWSAEAHLVAANRLGHAADFDEVTDADAVYAMSRHVVVLYASDTPLDTAALGKLVKARTGVAADTYVLSDALVAGLLAREKELVLTDQYCPVDNLMATVFLRSDR